MWRQDSSENDWSLTAFRNKCVHLSLETRANVFGLPGRAREVARVRVLVVGRVM